MCCCRRIPKRYLVVAPQWARLVKKKPNTKLRRAASTVSLLHAVMRCSSDERRCTVTVALLAGGAAVGAGAARARHTHCQASGWVLVPQQGDSVGSALACSGLRCRANWGSRRFRFFAVAIALYSRKKKMWVWQWDRLDVKMDVSRWYLSRYDLSFPHLQQCTAERLASTAQHTEVNAWGWLALSWAGWATQPESRTETPESTEG